MKIVKVKHENGLEGVLYGSYLSIFKDDREIIHGCTKIQTKEELSDMLGKLPGFFEDNFKIDLKDL